MYVIQYTIRYRSRSQLDWLYENSLCKKKQSLRVSIIPRISKGSALDKCRNVYETSEIFKEVNVTRKSTWISI